jgi:hypothetical protein
MITFNHRTARLRGGIGANEVIKIVFDFRGTTMQLTGFSRQLIDLS